MRDSRRELPTAVNTSVSLPNAAVAGLRSLGITTAFGIPGIHNLSIFDALSDHGIAVYGSRHEQGAAFMADGYARATKQPAICVVIDGPGVLNAATAIAQARADSVPMIILSPSTEGPVDSVSGRLHELPTQSSIMNGICRWSATIHDEKTLHAAMDRVFRSLSSERLGPIHLAFSLHHAEAESVSWKRPSVSPHSTDTTDQSLIDAAAEQLSNAQRPIVVAGGGAVAAQEEVVRIAERLAAPVIATTNAKGIVPTGHPLFVGGSPSLPSIAASLVDSDCVLMVGTEYGETDFDFLMRGQPRQLSNVIRIDIDEAQLTANVAPLIAIQGDAKEVLSRVHPDAGPNSNTARAAQLRCRVQSDELYHADYARLFETIREHTDILVGDSAQPNYYAMWMYEPKSVGAYWHSVSGFGTLGYAIPASVGTKIAKPDLRVAALIGDGGAQFTLSEIASGVQHGLGIPILVWDNHGYEEIKKSMVGRNMALNNVSHAHLDFCSLAKGFGAASRVVSNHDELGDAMDQAFHNKHPTIVVLPHDKFIHHREINWYQQ